jgi:hypothetical protein
MILCAILSAAVWYCARDLDLYASEDSVDYDDLELKDLRRKRNPKITSREATPAVKRRSFVPLASQGGGDVTVRKDNDFTDATEEVELPFTVLDLSDHMEDSMDEPSHTRRLSGVY